MRNNQTIIYIRILIHQSKLVLLVFMSVDLTMFYSVGQSDVLSCILIILSNRQAVFVQMANVLGKAICGGGYN